MPAPKRVFQVSAPDFPFAIVQAFYSGDMNSAIFPVAFSSSHAIIMGPTAAPFAPPLTEQFVDVTYQNAVTSLLVATNSPLTPALSIGSPAITVGTVIARYIEGHEGVWAYELFGVGSSDAFVILEWAGEGAAPSLDFMKGQVWDTKLVPSGFHITIY